MIVTLFVRLAQMFVLIALQVLVCNHIHLLDYAMPMIYVLFVSWMPLNSNRVGNLLWAFVMGLIVDIFSNTPGLASSAMVVTAFVQWPLLKNMVPEDSVDGLVPGYKTLGTWTYIRFLFILTFVHHTIFYILESFSFFNAIDVLITSVSSLALSLVLMLSVETMRKTK